MNLKNEKIVYFNSIGNITIRKSKRAKRISIKIKPIKGVFVTIPNYVSFKKGEKYLSLKKEWIINNLSKIKKIENNITVFNNSTDFKTRKRTLNIASHKENNVKVNLLNDIINIKYPAHIPVENTTIQNNIRQAIEFALRIEAKEYLPQRVEILAKKHDFSYKKVFVKNAKTIWGSCSEVNNINLNIHLLRLPDYLIDYIILHELCHTKEKNHKKSFWELLDVVYPNAKKYSKELKTYSLELY
ncbi:MAG: SprT family zinc-dependent metalloprotease [Bacteroidales bacterium]|nr:SprT family zinc-dependent metalloprotease [Bacteroidales bacterium]